MSRPIRLTVVAEGYPWGENLAGVFHRDQLRRIASQGIEVTVIGATPWVPPGLELFNSRWRAYKNPPSHQIDHSIKIFRPRYLAFPRENEFLLPDLAQYLAVRSLNLPRPDVIQGFYAIPPGALARRLAIYWGVPYLVGILGDDVNLYPHHNNRNMRVLKQVVSDAACVFANGPTLAKEAERLTGCEVETLSIGVRADRFNNLVDKVSARLELGLPADKFIVLYVGALSPAKGIKDLIIALDSIRNTSIICVVAGDGNLRSELEAKENTICLGILSPENVVKSMVAADLLVHPSHSEGLPTVLVEAGFAGLPILTTDARGCIDIACDGRAIVVPVGDANALAKEICRIAESPNSVEIQRCTSAMTAHVREQYSLDKNTDLLIQRYVALAGKKII